MADPFPPYIKNEIRKTFESLGIKETPKPPTAYDCPDGKCDTCKEFKDLHAKGVTSPPKNSPMYLDRNLCNKCPSDKPVLFKNPWLGRDTFKDASGGLWKAEQGGYHNDPDVADSAEATFRDADGDGYQCRYEKGVDGNWKLDDSSRYMGTYDYAAPSRDFWGHKSADWGGTKPGQIPYTGGLTTVY